jgi:signal transduction histidine kinase
MFRSLSSRLLLTYMLVAGLILAVVGASLLLFLLRNPLPQRQAYLRLGAVMDLVRARQDAIAPLSRPAALQRSLDWIDQAAQARAILLDPGGTILGDSRSGTAPPPVATLRALAQAQSARRGNFRDSTGSRFLYVSQPLDQGHALILITPFPRLPVISVLSDDFMPIVIRAGIVSLIASVLLAWLMSRWVAAPLKHMSGAARAVAEGDFNQIPAPKGPNEVQTLAHSFQHMAERVQASQQMERDFVANVSHELKTPLTSIQGFAQAILDGAAADTGSTQHAARVIYEEADRLRRLVKDLLDLAKLDTGEVEFERRRLDLQALLGNVIERMSVPAAEKEIELLERLPTMPTVIGDGDRLAQVFTNLVDNAIKHTPASGQVAIRGESGAGWVSIHVDDTGPGIPPDELARIFERFYQLDKARAGGGVRGVGLGLSISRQILQAHGGELTVESELGRGSRFTVKLPVAPPGAEHHPQPNQPDRI